MVERVTAMREYILVDESTSFKCDMCKVPAMRSIKLIPLRQTNSFHDDIILCYTCAANCGKILGLEVSSDIGEIVKAGGVMSWLKTQKA